MFVRAEGIREDGTPITRTWHLLAEGDDGPFIPTMAIAALARRLNDGGAIEPGARSGIRDVELSDYEAIFAGFRIHHGVRNDLNAESLYENILGSAYKELPLSLQEMHHNCRDKIVRGSARIDGADNAFGWLIARCFGFPKAGKDVPVSVTFTEQNGTETWTRSFNGKTMRSTQTAGRAAMEHLIVEQFGPFKFGLAVIVKDGRLALKSKRWNVLGVPLPRVLMPGGDASEFERDERFHFDVNITAPIIGRLVRYRGFLS